MLCPSCRSTVCRRSKRRGFLDHFLSLFGMRPWRCRTCESRFYGWSVAARFIFYVHCPRCGNMDLQKVARARVVEQSLTGLYRALHFPAYRCDGCRHRFFSLRKFRRITPTVVPTYTEEPAPEPAAAATAERSGRK